MTPPRSTHPCPACGHGVALSAQFCGGCGAAQPEQRDPALARRAALSALATRCRATDALPDVLVEALAGLGAAPAHRSPRIVIVGELGRGSRALANRLVGAPRLKAGPSQRGAPALLEQETDTASPESLLSVAAVEVAPPLAAGADSTTAGVIPAIMRADAVVFALSAAQLLSATERRLLTALAGLTDAPIALAVGRMEVAETDEDLDDIARRTQRFRDALAPAPAVFLLPAETDDAPRLEAWLREQLAQTADDTEVAWCTRATHLLDAVSAVLAASDQDAPALPELPALQAELSDAHASARAAAMARLEAGLGQVRDALADRLDEMSPEERVHEGSSELAIAIEALLRASVDAWRSELADALADAELPAASLQAAVDRPDTVGEVTGEAPKLAPRLPDQSYGLMAAAVGLSVGVLMLPAGGSGAIAIGLGLTAGSVAAARVLRGRRDEELRAVHTDALDGWLREVGVRAGDWLVDHVDGAHELIEARLGELHAHARGHHDHTTPAAIADAVAALRPQLDAA